METTTKKIELTTEIQELIRMNTSCKEINTLPLISEYVKIDGRYKVCIDFEKTKEWAIERAIKIVTENLQIIKDLQQKRAEFIDPICGDYIQYKNGNKERITYVWPDGQCQAGGGRGSFHLSNSGNASYSGGLNEGLHKNSLIDSGKTEKAEFWIFSRNNVGAGMGYNFQIDVKVFNEI